MKTIFLTTECECGGTADDGGCLDLTQDDSERVNIDIGFTCSQVIMECPKCGKKYYTGDVEILDEDEI